MLEPIQFDVQQGFDTEEIKEVRTKRVLPAKFVCGEAPVSKPTPKELLSPSVTFTECASDADERRIPHEER